MSTLIKGAIVALALTGATMGTANAAARFYVGPDGVRVAYSEGYYYDSRHHRQMYRYPADWRRYHHPQRWYREHREWYRDSDWYRR
ncbi:MAG TPA: hypothetical protein VK479_04655 [Micropepsaceae bacterium]|nr:hypothetical protein [Micropepsaceae bacterium]